jgi:hypothetical protein
LKPSSSHRGKSPTIPDWNWKVNFWKAPSIAEQDVTRSLELDIGQHKRNETLLNNLVAYLFLAPALLTIILVLFYPIANMVVTSMLSRPTLSRPYVFIGLENYV